MQQQTHKTGKHEKKRKGKGKRKTTQWRNAPQYNTNIHSKKMTVMYKKRKKDEFGLKMLLEVTAG
jgi:hypothetical protein